MLEFIEKWARRAREHRPDLSSRIGRAVQLVEAGAVHRNSKPKSFLVASQSQPRVGYFVDLERRMCGCPDHQQGGAPGGWCKHLIAACLVYVANEEAGEGGSPASGNPGQVTPGNGDYSHLSPHEQERLLTAQVEAWRSGQPVMII